MRKKLSFVVFLCSWTINVVSLAITLLLHSLICQPALLYTENQAHLLPWWRVECLPWMYLGNKWLVFHSLSESQFSLPLWLTWEPVGMLCLWPCRIPRGALQNCKGGGDCPPTVLSSPILDCQGSSTYGYMIYGRIGGGSSGRRENRGKAGTISFMITWLPHDHRKENKGEAWVRHPWGDTT